MEKATSWHEGDGKQAQSHSQGESGDKPSQVPAAHYSGQMSLSVHHASN